MIVAVFNFWEPLHFLHQGHGFQTWELSPVYALRSWAYILVHYMPPKIGMLFLSGDKVCSITKLIVTAFLSPLQ